ncbi:SERAC1 isoform X1 [Pelobates cultripes]|uniref:SERAC1 isoform X1 n=1 Tax=Pelobates cultripes TaxID=61616 RepID=A0AAD1VVI8_PELCU|nr:SERAC1 isoform X1 [Pelobates cultripes]
MSLVAYCLIRCRKISTSGTASRREQNWKNIRNIAKITGSLFLGGCMFVTYQTHSLRRSVTLDTQAVKQEKLKSYIYVYSGSAEQNNLQEIYLLHMIPNTFPKHAVTLAVHVQLAAKTCIAGLWKSQSKPDIMLVTDKINRTKKYEEMAHKIMGMLDKFNRTWGQWHD